MIEQLLTVFAFIVGGLLIYRFWPRIAAALQRFDRDNRARIEGEIRDRSDQLAHFRHTLKVAEEQVDDITEIEVSDARTGQPVKRYLFEGEHFVTQRDAQRAREDKVRALARSFYIELPAALSARKFNGKLGRD